MSSSRRGGTKRSSSSQRDGPEIPEDLRRRSARGTKGKAPDRLGKGTDAIEDVDERPATPTKKRKGSKRKNTYVVPDFSQASINTVKPPWDPAYNTGLESKYGSHPRCSAEYRTSGITVVNRDFPLCKKQELHHQGTIYGLAWSNDGTMLASCSSTGTIQLYSTESWKVVSTLRDPDETQIEEFYTMQFTPDDKGLFAAGKLKDRDVWDEEEDDNAILPCPIKLFDIPTGNVLVKLHGHEEEVLDIKLVLFRDENYLLSASQDGYLIKWRLAKDWGKCTEVIKIDPTTSCMLMRTAFLPGCGNKYFIAAADEGVKIYDFEAGVVLQAFEGLYGQYCDCVTVVDLPSMHRADSVDFLFLSRGVVPVKSHQKVEKIVSEVRLHRLSAPLEMTDQSKAAVFEHEVLSTYSDERYHANIWPLTLAVSGSYLLAPALHETFFGWNILTGALVCVCVAETPQAGAFRDIRFHPSRPCVAVAGDSSIIYVYDQATDSEPGEKPWYDGHVDRSLEIRTAQKELQRLIDLSENITVKKQLQGLVDDNDKLLRELEHGSA